MMVYLPCPFLKIYMKTTHSCRNFCLFVLFSIHSKSSLHFDYTLFTFLEKNQTKQLINQEFAELNPPLSFNSQIRVEKK